MGCNSSSSADIQQPMQQQPMQQQQQMQMQQQSGAASGTCAKPMPITSDKPKIQIIYFGGRNKGDTLRNLLTYTGHEFENVFMTMEMWGDVKGKTEFGGLPVARLGHWPDRRSMGQHVATFRSICIKNKLYDTADWKQSYLGDSLVDGFLDVRGKFEMPFVTGQTDQLEDVANGIFKKFVERAEARLEKQGTSHLTCDKVMMADLYIWFSIEASLLFENNPKRSCFQTVIDTCPKFKAWCERMDKDTKHVQAKRPEQLK